MKYKIIGLSAVVVIIIVAFVAQNTAMGYNRYHQHRNVNQKGECTEHGSDVFCTHLPLLNITTDEEMPDAYLYDSEGNQIPNDTMVGATVEYFDNETENNHLTDAKMIESRAFIRIRGASSREYDKKSYLLKFTQEDGIDKRKVSLSGMTPDDTWVLQGPFLDKTLIRNYMCYNMAGEIMEYAPNVRFCEAFLNGEYIGVYLLVEKIDYNDNGRIQITKSDPELETTSYIVGIDRGNQEPSTSLLTFGTHSYLSVPEGEKYGQLFVEYPNSTLTEQQRKYIEKDISKFEKSLYSFAYADVKEGYRQYIDVQSFVDYFLINEFTLNYDAMVLSTYLYKDLDGKMKLCVWDFNSTFDNYQYSTITPKTFLVQEGMWYNFLFKDKYFVDRVTERYYDLRETFFNEEYLFTYIDETIAYLGPAIERNYEKWGYSFQSEYEGRNIDYLIPEERNVRSYDEAVAQLKDCIKIRIEHMDTNLERLYTLCHESLNKKYNYDKGGLLQ